MCPPGYQCPDTSLTLFQRCPLGTYSVGGQQVCTTCPAGNGCDATSTYLCQPGMVSLAGDGYCRYYSNAEYSSTVVSPSEVDFLYCP